MGHENTHLDFPEAVSENNLFSHSINTLNPCTKRLVYNCWFDWMYNLNLKAFQVLSGNHREFPCSKRECSVYFSSLIRWDGGFNPIKWGKFWLEKKNLDSMVGDWGQNKSGGVLGKQHLQIEFMSLVPRLLVVRFLSSIQTYKREIPNLMIVYFYLQWQTSSLFIRMTHNFVLLENLGLFLFLFFFN